MKKLLIALSLLLATTPAYAENFTGKFKGPIFLYFQNTNIEEIVPPDSIPINIKISDNGRSIKVTDYITGKTISLRRAGNRATAQKSASYASVSGLLCIDKITFGMKRTGGRMQIYQNFNSACEDGSFLDARYLGYWNLRR